METQREQLFILRDRQRIIIQSFEDHTNANVKHAATQPEHWHPCG